MEPVNVCPCSTSNSTPSLIIGINTSGGTLRVFETVSLRRRLSRITLKDMSSSREVISLVCIAISGQERQI